MTHGVHKIHTAVDLEKRINSLMLHLLLGLKQKNQITFAPPTGSIVFKASTIVTKPAEELS